MFFCRTDLDAEATDENLIMRHACCRITKRCVFRWQYYRYCLWYACFVSAIRCRYSSEWFIALLPNNTIDIQKGAYTWGVTICVYFITNVRYTDHIKSFVSWTSLPCFSRHHKSDTTTFFLAKSLYQMMMICAIQSTKRMSAFKTHSSIYVFTDTIIKRFNLNNTNSYLKVPLLIDCWEMIAIVQVRCT